MKLKEKKSTGCKFLQSQGNTNEKQVNMPIKGEEEKKKQSLMRTIKRKKKELHGLPKSKCCNSHVA